MSNMKLNKTMKDVQWSFISLAMSSVVHLLLRIVLGRKLGPSGLGVYTLVFTIYLFGMQFAAFGIDAALIKYVAEFSDDLATAKEYISSGIISCAVTGITMGIFLFLISEMISVNFFNIPKMENLLKVTALCFPFMALYKVSLGSLNGFRQMKKYALLEIALNASIFLVSVLFVITFNMDLQGAVYGFVLPIVVIGMFSLTSISNNFIKPTSLLTDACKELTTFGFFVIISGSVGMLYHQVDSLMIGHFMDEKSVGFYAIAAIFIQGLALIPNAIQRITTPVIALHYSKREYDQILNLIKNVLVKTYLLTFIIFLLLVLFGKDVIVFFFTKEYLPAYIPLVILLIGYAINAPIGSIGGIMGSIGKINLSFKIALLSTIINLVANFMLIPKYGLIGASTATSFSFIINTVLYYLILRKVVHNWISF